jgi:hypothetical protein
MHDYQSEQLGWSVGGQLPEASTQRVLTRLPDLKVSSLFSQRSLASSDFARAGSFAVGWLWFAGYWVCCQNSASGLGGQSRTLSLGLHPYLISPYQLGPQSLRLSLCQHWQVSFDRSPRRLRK